MAAILVSCKKKTTPADQINSTTQNLEGEAAKLQKEAAAKKAEAEKVKAPKVDLPK
jgi:hypothetical protein